MRKNGRSDTKASHGAYAPLAFSALNNDAERLFQAYISTFETAPEADYLLKRYFFTIYFEKEYLQENVFFIPRAGFLWYFKYHLGEDHTRTIELKKRSSSKAEREIEVVTIAIRQFGTDEQEPVEIIYTRSFEDQSNNTFTLKNTDGATALAEKVLADFRDDPIATAAY
jgi:hypothetical protein